jgi:Ca2+-binding EF-hand superfamily protein
MKLTTLKLGVFALSLFAYSQTASAQDQQKRPDPEKMFKGLDTNNDGSVTLEEFKNKERKREIPADRLEKMYGMMDADSNGSVTLEEYKSAMDKMKERRMGEGAKKNKQNMEKEEGDN